MTDEEQQEQSLGDFYHDGNYDEKQDKPEVKTTITLRQYGTEVQTESSSVSAACAAFLQATEMVKHVHGYAGPKKGSAADDNAKEKARRQQFAIKSAKKKRGQK